MDRGPGLESPKQLAIAGIERSQVAVAVGSEENATAGSQHSSGIGSNKEFVFPLNVPVFRINGFNPSPFPFFEWDKLPPPPNMPSLQDNLPPL